MKNTQKMTALALGLLLGATAYGLYVTGETANAPVAPRTLKYGAAAQAPIVDQTPLQTAQRLAKMPISGEELPFAQEALRLADHEMDLAFGAGGGGGGREGGGAEREENKKKRGRERRKKRGGGGGEGEGAKKKKGAAKEKKAIGE